MQILFYHMHVQPSNRTHSFVNGYNWQAELTIVKVLLQGENLVSFAGNSVQTLQVQTCT